MAAARQQKKSWKVWRGTHLVSIQLAIGTNIKQSASGVVGSSAKCIAIGEELNGINIRLVSRKRLHGLASPNIPQLSESVAGTGDEHVAVGRIDADAHDVAEVVGELGDFGPGLDVP